MKIVKLALFIIGCSIFMSFSLFGQLLLNENFGYGASDNADIRSVAVIASDTLWRRHSGAQGPAYRATGLTYTSYGASGIGGAMWSTKGGSGVNDGDVHRVFSDSVSTTSDVYVSFMVKLDSAQATADYFFHLGPRTIGTTFRARVFARSNGAGWSLGLSKSTETAVTDATVLAFGQTYLIILKYSFNTAAITDDVVTLYLYSSGVPTTEPGSPTLIIGPFGAGLSGDPVSIGAAAIRQGTNTPTGMVDGIRAATSFSSVLTSLRSVNRPVEKLSLDQNFPNPFNPETIIRFDLPQRELVSLKVYNMLGQEVASLVTQELVAGRYEVRWDGKNQLGNPVSTGMYIYRLHAGSFTEARKMLLVR